MLASPSPGYPQIERTRGPESGIRTGIESDQCSNASPLELRFNQGANGSNPYCHTVEHLLPPAQNDSPAVDFRGKDLLRWLDIPST